MQYLINAVQIECLDNKLSVFFFPLKQGKGEKVLLGVCVENELR